MLVGIHIINVTALRVDVGKNQDPVAAFCQSTGKKRFSSCMIQPYCMVFNGFSLS